MSQPNTDVRSLLVRELYEHEMAYQGQEQHLADGILSAIASAGYTIIPRNPTRTMGDAGAKSHLLISWGMAEDCYRAMIAEYEESER